MIVPLLRRFTLNQVQPKWAMMTHSTLLFTTTSAGCELPSRLIRHCSNIEMPVKNIITENTLLYGEVHKMPLVVQI